MYISANENLLKAIYFDELKDFNKYMLLEMEARSSYYLSLNFSIYEDDFIIYDIISFEEKHNQRYNETFVIKNLQEELSSCVLKDPTDSLSHYKTLEYKNKRRRW